MNISVPGLLRGEDVGDRREASAGKHWEVLEDVLAGLGTCDKGICAGASRRGGVVGGQRR
jgi:hypothetical protein